jgi:hypothetical protein
MNINPFFLLMYVCCLLMGYTEDIYYQSDALKQLDVKPIAGAYSILDDNQERVEITALEDGQGILYWYRRIKTPVCLTGECKLIDIGIYWDCTGSFLGLEVYGEHLTKTDHSNFSQQDYDHLISILQNDWSVLREYALTDLVEDPSGEVDGASGATKKEIAAEAVADAVYTTHTIWHLIHQGEKEQLATLTLAELKSNRDLTDKLLKSGRKEYSYFLLELVGSGKLEPSAATDALVINGLKAADDPYLKKVALQALARTDVNPSSVQTELAAIYRQVALDEKLQILSALKDVHTIEQDLYEALSHDLAMENEWFLIKILNVLKHASQHSEQAITAARKLAKSENSLVKQTATEFLNNVN